MGWKVRQNCTQVSLQSLCGVHELVVLVGASNVSAQREGKVLADVIDWHARGTRTPDRRVRNEPETRAFGAEIGFIMCTTPPYSPESNGMAESFVKSLKRDYVYLADRWTAADVLRDLPRWFDDYNRVRPHKGLRMLSPVEFRNTQLAS